MKLEEGTGPQGGDRWIRNAGGPGKGDTPRPLSVDPETFQKNWERTFGRKERADG